MTKPRHKGARETRLCIFCGLNANSKEHFWPTWLHPLIVKPAPDERHDRQAVQYHPKTGERTSGPRARPGGVHTVRIRAVCTSCNSGWMNRLEAEARPIVTALATAEQTIFGEDSLYSLAKWITLKCLVAEYSVPSTAMTPKADRLAFMRNGKIPDYFKIYAALNVSGHDLGYIRHSHCMALSADGPVPPLDGTTQNIQTISFLLGKAFVHVNAFRLEGFDFESRANIIPFWQRCRIWPTQTIPVAWPRRPALDTDGIRTVSEVLGRYIHGSNVTWM